ncbi:MAG: hypothetical protein AAF292_10170 [Pseudomonadota bacterium]
MNETIKLLLSFAFAIVVVAAPSFAQTASQREFLGVKIGAPMASSDVSECLAPIESYDEYLSIVEANDRECRRSMWKWGKPGQRAYDNRVRKCDKEQYRLSRADNNYLPADEVTSTCWRRCIDRACGVKFNHPRTSRSRSFVLTGPSRVLFAESYQYGDSGYGVRKLSFANDLPEFIHDEPYFLTDDDKSTAGVVMATSSSRRAEGLQLLTAKYGKPTSENARSEILRNGQSVDITTHYWDLGDIIVHFEPITIATVFHGFGFTSSDLERGFLGVYTRQAYRDIVGTRRGRQAL